MAVGLSKKTNFVKKDRGVVHEKGLDGVQLPLYPAYCSLVVATFNTLICVLRVCRTKSQDLTQSPPLDTSLAPPFV